MSSKLSSFVFFLACFIFAFFFTFGPEKLKCYGNEMRFTKLTSQTTRILCVSYERPSLLPNVRQKITLHKKVYVLDTVKRHLWSGPNYTIVHDSAYSDKHHFRTISGLAANVLGNRKLFSGLVPVYVV